MKHILLSALVIVVASTGVCQIPLPSVRYTEDNFHALQLFSGQRPTNKLEIQTDQNTGQQMTHLQDAASREFIVEEAVIDPGFSYEPAPGSDGEFKIFLGNRSDMEGAWFEPINYFPQLYEKIEWGVKLPDEVEAAIDNWIWNDQNPTLPPLVPALNPFDPEQIDLQAIVDYTTSEGVYYSQPVFGFFYQPFSRNTVYNNPHNEDLDDPDDWYWDELTTPYRFRFRWSSTVISHHSVRIKLDVPSMGHWEMEPFEFDSYWGDPRSSFVSVTENGHYFKTDDGHVYFPVGLNFNEATFGCNCKIVGFDSNDCYECYDDPLNDPCCGISTDKQKRHSMPGTTLKERCIAAAGYVKLEWILEKLSASGANAFRTINDPINFEIEFEKLNNYYERQYQAWEFDQMLDKCDELDLRIEWNHLIHYSIGHHWYGGDNWDWDNSENNSWTDVRPNDSGYAYWNGCPGDLSPVDFLTDTCTVENYKKKLRYMIARWGYSKNIFVMELASEINNIGAGEFNGEELPKPYDTQQEIVRPAVAYWHNEMARYIKEDLQHTRHLIAADYTGKAPMQPYPDSDAQNPCGSEYFDNSWQSQYIDVIAYSNYGGSVKKFNGLSDAFGAITPAANSNNEMNVYPGFMCNESASSEIIGFEHTTKPVIHAETGFIAFDCDATGFIKELMATPFGGYASSGMSWDEWNSTNNWHWMHTINDFLENELLNSIDIGTEEWIPDWTESSNSGESGHVEAIYLRNDTPNHKKLIGVIINRTWNWFTANVGGECDQIPMTTNEENSSVEEDLGVLPIFIRTQLDIGGGEEPLRIPYMELLKTYRIQYFNPLDGSLLNEETTNTLDHVLGLEGYPMLTQALPFVFFKAWRDPIGPENDQFAPTIDSQFHLSENRFINQISSANSLSSSNNESFDSILNEKVLTSIWPKITSSIIKVSHSDKETYDLAIFDSSGKVVMSCNRFINNSTLDVTHLSSGVYFIRIVSEGDAQSFIKN